MEFNPANPVVRLCLQGMEMEDSGKRHEALRMFMQAWNEATNDFERFLAAWYVARCQEAAAEKLQWYQAALQLAVQVDDNSVKGALTALHRLIANCYNDLGEPHNAGRHNELVLLSVHRPTDKGPFYHGTRADLRSGDFLTAGHSSNYKSELVMNHIYFTALPGSAGLAAALAKGEGSERVYIVEPTSDFEDDPNVTNKKFPGNPTRSYRTTSPLKIVGELADWVRQTPEQIQQWKNKVAKSTGEIIN